MSMKLLCVVVSCIALFSFALAAPAAPDALSHEELSKKFAPIVYLMSEDEYRPSSFEWYMKKVWISYGEIGDLEETVCVNATHVTMEILAYGLPDNSPCKQYEKDGSMTTDKDLSKTNADNNRKWNMRNNCSSDFDDDCEIVKGDTTNCNGGKGSQCNVPMYATLSSETDDQLVFTYFFFYPFNGAFDVFGWKAGAHESDLENIQVYVKKANSEYSLEKVYYSQHSGGTMYQANEIEVRNNEQAVVYSAKGSHASYKDTGTQKREHFAPIYDHTDDGGPVWDGSTNTVFLTGSPDKKLEEGYLYYVGAWGTNHEHGCFDHFGIDECTMDVGPAGPATRSYWKGIES